MPKADFSTWTREGLESIARQAVDENKQLREDNKLLLAAWRQAISERYLAGVPDGSPAPLSLPQSLPPASGTPSGGQR
jgi:hypothetical protein